MADKKYVSDSWCAKLKRGNGLKALGGAVARTERIRRAGGMDNIIREVAAHSAQHFAAGAGFMMQPSATRDETVRRPRRQFIDTPRNTTRG